jgi:four helix bundle protein
MKQYSFEKLECWQQARKLAVWIYQVTNVFPGAERFGISAQMRRAAISIASNIAEGTSRKSYREQAYFTTVAYSSTIELLNDLIISHDLKFIREDELLQGREMVESLTWLISRLRASQHRPDSVTKPS